MIELQRAKLGLPPAGTTPSMNTSQSATGNNSSSTNNAFSAKQPSPAEVANATLLSEDAQIERFINRLQRRDRKTTSTHHHHSNLLPSSSGPTVPSALSRRMLHRQGVGYLDDTVASVVSASADRFLATVLQQAIACRDQRLKGAAMTREAFKQRKRHMDDYDADNDDRKRRKESIVKAREDIAKFTIEAAEAIKKGGGAGSGKTTASLTPDKKTIKKKKGIKKEAATPSMPVGPKKLDPAMEALAMEESEEEYDSIDEEEEYYQENVVGVTRERISLKKTSNGGYDDEEDDEDEDEESDDEDDDTLLLRDIVRPLKSWNFHLNGKEAIETDDDNDEIESDDDTQDGENSKTNTNESTTQQAEENSRSDNHALNTIMNEIEESKQQSNEKKQGDAPSNGNKNGAAKKANGAASSSTTHPPSSS